VREAEQAAEKEGVGNVVYRAGDLLEHDFGDARFDYIIAHGFLSWTPEATQQRLLEVCRDHLAERGVALISYNAMPGCATRDALRRLFLLEAGESNESAAAPGDPALAAADRVLGFFEAALPGVRNLPHAAGLRSTIQRLRNRHPTVLVHDELGAVSEPYYLLQFTQWAGETGLTYVADVDLRLDWLDVHPKETKAAVIRAGMPRLKALQYADYLLNTAFRRSLVCRARDAETLRPMPDPAAVLGLSVRSRLEPVGPIAVSPGLAIRYHVPEPEQRDDGERRMLEVTDPLAQAVLSELAARRERPVPMAEVWRRAVPRAGLQNQPSAEAVERIGRLVLQAVCRGQMSVYAGPYPPECGTSGVRS